MTYLVRYDAKKSIVELINKINFEVLDTATIPKTFIHAPYLAIIKGAYLALKNNILVYKMEGWSYNVCSMVDEWFGKSFPLKFKYPNKDLQFWLKSSQELVDKSFLNNALELLEKAIIFIFGAINKIYIDNPNAVKLEVEYRNYSFESYNPNKAIEHHFEDFNLFSDASVRDLDKVTTIAGLIKDKNNNVIVMYRSKVNYNIYKDSNLAEMLAITEGLKVAIDMGIPNIKVFTDSMCAVEKLQKYSPYYKSLFSDNVEDIIKQIKGFNKCKFIHVNRHYNNVADELTHF